MGPERQCLLCATCAKGFARRGKFGCGKCPDDNASNVAVLFGLVLFVALMVVFLIWKRSKKAGAFKGSSAMKTIILDSAQVTALFTGMVISWPPVVQDTFEVVAASSSLSTETGVSLSCALPWVQEEPFLRRRILVLFLLPGGVVLSILVWTAVWCVQQLRNKKKRKKEKKETTNGGGGGDSSADNASASASAGQKASLRLSKKKSSVVRRQNDTDGAFQQAAVASIGDARTFLHTQ